MGILMETSEGNSVGGNRRAMGAPGEYYETLHTIAITTRETEFGSYVEPIPITLKAYKHIQTLGHPANGYGFPQSVITPLNPVPRTGHDEPALSVIIPSPIKEDRAKVARPPKKKWIKEYLEEEPKSVSVQVSEVSVARSNGVVRLPSPPPAPAAPLAPPAAPAPPVSAPPEPLAVAAPLAPILEFAQEHSRPRATNNCHGPTQIPSPPSVSSNGSNSSNASNVSLSSNGSNGGLPRAGTREVHNKLEKNRRAHLKECFELLKRQLPAAPDDKKTSNLSILGSAIRYIQVLRRKERECEHEMERLAREKIASQQRLAALKREVTIRATARPRPMDAASEEKDREDVINGQILGLPINISTSPGATSRAGASPSPSRSPPRTLNLSTKLRALPVQIAPTASQVVRAAYGARGGGGGGAGALTLTAIAPADSAAQKAESGVKEAFGALVQPAQIHLPISQVVGGGGLVVGPHALQLLSGAGLRLQHTHSGVTTDNRISKENGIVTTAAVSTEGGSVVVSGLTPLMVSQSAAHLLSTHTLTHKMVETQMVTGSVSPLAVSAQYLSTTTIVKPVVVVTSASAPAPPPARDRT